MMKDFTDLNGFTWKFPLHDEHFVEYLSINPEYQPKQKKMMLDRPHLLDLSWVLDVGANVGLWTRWLKNNGAGRIDCFEPIANTATCLRINTQDLESIHIHEIGLSDANKRMMLYNLENTPDSGWYTSTPDETFVPYGEMQCEKLDAFDFSPTFIKVNIQGGEMEFLLGAEETIKRCRPVFVIEGEPGNPEQETIIWLKDRGYRIECATSSDYLMVAE